jgi:hypothetical protein
VNNLPRKLRVYDLVAEWSRIRVRLASKPDSIRVTANGQTDTLFEPRFGETHRKAEIYGSTLVNPMSDILNDILG